MFFAPEEGKTFLPGKFFFRPGRKLFFDPEEKISTLKKKNVHPGEKKSIRKKKVFGPVEIFSTRKKNFNRGRSSTQKKVFGPKEKIDPKEKFDPEDKIRPGTKSFVTQKKKFGPEEKIHIFGPEEKCFDSEEKICSEKKIRPGRKKFDPLGLLDFPPVRFSACPLIGLLSVLVFRWFVSLLAC